MRLYKLKDVPKQVHRNVIDSPPDSPSSSSGSPTPHRLRRAAEAVSKQISGHKAMVAHFKETKLPRPPIFSMRSATQLQTDHSLPAKQSKTTKRSAISQNIPARRPISKVPASANAKQRSAPLSSINTNLPTPTKPPGLGFEKSTTRPTKVPAPLSASGKSKPVPSLIHSPSQRASPSLVTCPTTLASTRTDLSSISVISALDEVDIDGPLLSGSCFNSPEEDSELEDDLFEMAELSVSSFESQVAQIFGMGLGPVAEKEVIRRGEIAPPIATPEPSFASTMEPMSVTVGWWEPANNAAVEREAREIPTDSESKGRLDGSGAAAPDQNQDPCTPTTKNVPAQPLSSTDYEYVASMGQDAFFTLSLGIHRRSQRKCLIKVISNAIVDEGGVVRAVLEEQRIMREASDYPFLSRLVTSFHDANGFYLISDYCRSTLFDERAHMPESRKKLASAELACAVDHLHGLGIVHRDIKLENVMLKNDGHVVLGNFGLALRLGAPRRGGSVRVDKSKTLKARGVCGTLPYMAPEMLSDKEYSYGVDWFAYGVFLHVFYMDKFPWMGEYEHPASYLKEMTSTMSLGFILENRSFGDLLNKLLCVNEDARANFSVLRGARFFADFDWQSVIPSDSPSSSVSPRPTGDEHPLSIGNNSQHHIDSDPYSGFTWLNPSIVEESKPDIGSVDWSPESSVAKPYTPSQLDGPTIERSPFACGSLQFSSSFSLSYLYRHSTFDFDPENHANDVLRRLERPLGEDPVSASPAECAAALEDSNVYLGEGTVAIPTRDSDDDEALVRMSIKSLDIGEEPVFDLPSGWKEAFAPPTGVEVPPSSKPQSTKKTSVLPKFKTLWKRVASKLVSRRV